MASAHGSPFLGFPRAIDEIPVPTSCFASSPTRVPTPQCLLHLQDLGRCASAPPAPFKTILVRVSSSSSKIHRRCTRHIAAPALQDLHCPGAGAGRHAAAARLPQRLPPWDHRAGTRVQLRPCGPGLRPGARRMLQGSGSRSVNPPSGMASGAAAGVPFARGEGRTSRRRRGGPSGGRQGRATARRTDRRRAQGAGGADSFMRRQWSPMLNV